MTKETQEIVRLIWVDIVKMQEGEMKSNNVVKGCK